MKYFLILFSTLIISCKDSENEKQLDKKEFNFFDETPIWNSKGSILNIYCEFSECGEWGGHKEYIVVSKNDDRTLKLNYSEYSVNCDSMVQVFNGIGYLKEPKSKLIASKEIDINEKEKRAILDFSNEMVKSKFNEKFPGHAGLVLSIANSDSTFRIQTYGGKADHYLKLLRDLELKK